MKVSRRKSVDRRSARPTTPVTCHDDHDDDDDDDIYIMMKCLLVSVTKNHHFLKRPVCLSVCLFVRFILTSLKVESRK